MDNKTTTAGKDEPSKLYTSIFILKLVEKGTTTGGGLEGDDVWGDVDDVSYRSAYAPGNQ